MFLSIMMWLILDAQKSPALLVDGDKVYAVTQVVEDNDSGINVDDTTEDQEDAEQIRQLSYSLTPVSRLMIDQFFKEVEGPDRDWHDEDYEIEMDHERPTLLIEE